MLLEKNIYLYLSISLSLSQRRIFPNSLSPPGTFLEDQGFSFLETGFKSLLWGVRWLWGVGAREQRVPSSYTCWDRSLLVILSSPGVRGQPVIAVLQGRKQAGDPQQGAWSPDTLGGLDSRGLCCKLSSCRVLMWRPSRPRCGESPVGRPYTEQWELLIYPILQLPGHENFKF